MNRTDLKQYIRTNHPQMAYFAVSLATAIGAYLYGGLLFAFFVLSFTSDLHVMLVIVLKAKAVLDSKWWNMIFVSMAISLGLTGSAVALVAHPLTGHGPLVALLWFGGFTLKRVLFTVGFDGHVRDMTKVFESDDYVAPLPAVPPTED